VASRKNDNAMTSASSGTEALNLLAWVRRQGWLQPIYRLLPERLRQRAANVLKARSRRRLQFHKTAAWASPLPSLPAGQLPLSRLDVAPLALDIYGFIRGQFGLGESVRLYARALIAAGCEVALHDVDLNLRHGWNDRSLEAFIRDESVHDVSIIFINPDCFEQALDKIGRHRLAGKYVIGCWFWELETVPTSWQQALDDVDAIMVASDFVGAGFRKVTSKPILKVPLPLSVVPDSGLARSDFGLEEESFVFLTTFDFNSHVARKNPHAVIAAFREAFPVERQDVRLLVKSSNGNWHDESLRVLLQAGGGDPRIIYRDEIIDRAHVRALQRCCDAYVSLHRAEGFGLGLAECMELGKPVIATGWSGNLEFMTPDNACLVDYRLIPVGTGEYPDGDGSLWAEADLPSAVAAMKRLADSPAEARKLGLRAQAHVRAALSPVNAADLLIAQVMSATGRHASATHFA